MDSDSPRLAWARKADIAATSAAAAGALSASAATAAQAASKVLPLR